MKLFFHFITIILLTIHNAYAIPIIRDAEIESVIREISNPIFRAAELEPSSIRIFIVNDKSINAFVAGGQNIFLNTGLMSISTDPDMLTGVIAHETGHIAGGHLARNQDEFSRTTMKATLGYLIGIAAVAAGSPAAGQAIAVGSSHVAKRQLLKYTRSHEEAADQAALKYLTKTKNSADGLLKLLEILYGREVALYGELNPYTLTHPLSRERITHIKNFTAAQGNVAPNTVIKEKFARSIVKLRAFLEDYEETLKQFPLSDQTINAKYARSIAYYKIPNIERSILEIDEILAKHPHNAYFNELKGQILFENGRVLESIPFYQKATKYDSSSPLLKIQLAIAQISSEEDNLLPSSINNLEQALLIENDNIFAWHQLAIAYGRSGQLGLSNLALAEEALRLKNKKDVEKFVRLAKKYIQEGSPTYLRLEDIKSSMEQIKKK